MQLTHLGHSSVLVETGGKRLLVDPGNMTDAWHGLTGLDAVLVTHQHADHVDTEHLGALLAANPTARVLMEPSAAEQVAEKVAGDANRIEELPVGTTVQLGEVSIEAVGGKHAIIHPDLPGIGNVGLVVRAPGEPTFFDPGDMLDTVPEGIEVLAIPAHGPWAAMKEHIDFVRAVGARRGFLVHEGLLNERGYKLVFDRMGELTDTVVQQDPSTPFTIEA